MTDSKHDAVWDWLQDCPSLSDLYFNFGETGQGDTVIAPVSAIKDTLAEGYIDGTALRWYDFAVLRYEAYGNDPNDTGNIDVLNKVTEIATWIEAQNKIQNFPSFPDGETISEITVLPDAGYIAQVDENGAKYMLQIRIEYLANS